jgi:predicted nucleotidyltransferase
LVLQESAVEALFFEHDELGAGHFAARRAASATNFRARSMWFASAILPIGLGTVRTEIAVSREQLAEFCAKWRIAELRVFGSVLRDDLRTDSDLDLLVSFLPAANWSLLDHIAMEEELSRIVGRKVDLVSQRGIERSGNWIRRKAILESAEPYFVAR